MSNTLLNKHRIVTIPESCGGTLTAATIVGLTPERFEAYANTEHALARAIAESVEARAVGLVPRPLTELLMGRIKEIGKGELQKRKVGKQSIILPYTYRRRKTNYNTDVFVINSGAANANAGSTVGGIAYPASAWDIVVGVGPSYKASSALTNLERYFLPGQYIYVENLDNAGAAGARTAYMTAYKVVRAVNTTTTTATITIAPNYSAAGWSALNSGQKAVYQPEFGVVQIGANSVSDYQSWCYNEAAEHSASLLVDWHQTSRYTQCHNDEYDRILKEITAGNVNEFLKEFQWLPLAEQNRKMRKQFEDKWMRTIFYGQRINEHQTPETYDDLPQVVDPDDGTVYEYQANVLGLRTLLAQESPTCVIDAAGAPMDLDMLFQRSYEVKEYREIDGSTVDVVDWMTDKDSAHIIHIAMIDFLKRTYGFDVTQFFSTGQVLDSTSGLVRFKYNKYDIPGFGFQIAVFVDQYFTDRVLSFGNGSGGAQGAIDYRSRGRAIWAIDWSDFDIGLIATNQAKREYRGETFANVNPLFSCVITPNTKHYELRSQTYTTRLGDARRSFIYENYDLSICPTLTVSMCAPGSV